MLRWFLVALHIGIKIYPLWKHDLSWQQWKSLNVTYSFMIMWSRFSELTKTVIWRQNEHSDDMQNLSAHFIFQDECRMKIGHFLFPFVLSELRIRVLEGHCQCVRMINKNRIFKNWSCERAFIEKFPRGRTKPSSKWGRVNHRVSIKMNWSINYLPGRHRSIQKSNIKCSPFFSRLDSNTLPTNPQSSKPKSS